MTSTFSRYDLFFISRSTFRPRLIQVAQVGPEGQLDYAQHDYRADDAEEDEYVELPAGHAEGGAGGRAGVPCW